MKLKKKKTFIKNSIQNCSIFSMNYCMTLFYCLRVHARVRTQQIFFLSIGLERVIPYRTSIPLHDVYNIIQY